MSIFFNYFFLLLTLCSMTNIMGQSATDWAVEKACQCLSAVDSLKPKQGEACLEKAVWAELEQLLKEANIDKASADALPQLAQVLVDQLLQSCPAYQRYAQLMAKENLEAAYLIWNQQTGLLTALDTKSWPARFTLLDSLGHEHDFYWIREFDGSARFFNGLSGYESTEVELIWQENYYYNPKDNSYQAYQEVVRIEELKKGSKAVLEQKYWSKVKTKRRKRKRKK